MQITRVPKQTEIKTIVTQEEKIVLELTREEAEVLCVVAGGMSGKAQVKGIEDLYFKIGPMLGIDYKNHVAFVDKLFEEFYISWKENS
jgi:hypothetical protein